MTPEEADQAAAQLPSELKAVWGEGETAARRPVKMRRDEIYEAEDVPAQLSKDLKEEWAEVQAAGVARTSSP